VLFRSLRPSSTLDILELTIKAIREQGQELEEIRQWKAKTEMIAEENMNELQVAQLESGIVPVQSKVSRCRQIVARVAIAMNVPHSEVWSKIYDDLLYLYGIRIRAYKHLPNESHLAVAERHGFADKILLLASELARKYRIA
jgi:hypothetical protein